MSVNPLHDGNLSIMVGTLNVTSAAYERGWSNSMPGGHGDCHFKLAGSLAGAWSVYHAQVVKGATVVVSHSGTELFRGIITGDVSHATIEGGQVFYEVTAAGIWWKAGVRKDFCRGYVDSDFTQWQPFKWNHRNYEWSNDGTLDMRINEGNSVKANKKVGFYYWLHNGLCDSADEYVDHVECMLAYDLGASWYFDTHYGAGSPWGTITLDQRLNDAASSSASFRIPSSGSLPSTTKMVRMSLYPFADQTSVSRDLFATASKLRVYIGSSARRHESTISTIATGSPATITTLAAHNLKSGDVVFIRSISGETPNVAGYYTVTVTGTTTFTIPVNVTVAGTGGTVCAPLRVEEIMADAATLTGLASSATTSALTDAAPNGVQQAMARPFTTVAEFLDEMAALADEPFEWGFWTNFEVGPKTAPAGASSDRYWIDAGDPAIDYAVFKDDEYSYDYVRILYKFRDVEGGTSVIPDGTIQAAYASRSGASPTDPGWSNMGYRVYTYDASAISLTTAQAQLVASQVVAWIGSHVYRGTIKIATPTVPLYGGGTKNTGYIKAGDWIEESSASTGLLYIADADWDDDSATMTLTIGVDPKEFVPNLHPTPSAAGGDGLPGGPRLRTLAA